MAVDIDADVGRWILEFLPSQPLDDRLLNFLINILPVPNDNLGLRKSILIRKLESEVVKQTISETLLDLLEQIQVLDFHAGNLEPSVSIKIAYLEAAVACTVRNLMNSGGNSRFEYLDAVKRIWKGRMCKLEKTEATGLISEELWSWKNDIEAAVWEDSPYGILLEKSKGINALEAIGLYVKEEKGKTGPSFLESVAEAFRADAVLRALYENHGQVRDTGIDLQGDGQHDVSSHEKREMHKGNVISRGKQVARECSKGAAVGTNRGAKIAVIDTSYRDESCKRYDLPTTPEVNRVHEALKLSALELQAVVKDPLPDALRIAENVVSDITRKNTINESMEESLRRADPSAVQDSQPTQANRENMPNDSRNMPQYNGSKSSLMARNGTACTFEWEDSIDNSPIEGCRVQLPSPKRRAVVSPPKPYESCKITRRRRKKRWSSIEEDTLRAGVEKFGRGNWLNILNAYKNVFDERTSGDLKDKWRNLCGEK